MPLETSAPAPAPVSFGRALRYWLRLGLISFGGPAGQIATLHHDLVEQRRWISERRFLHALNFCMLLPGPEAQQLATYLGWLLHRTRGGVAAGVLFVLPSFVLLVVLSWIYVAYGSVPAIAGIFHGIKPAVIAIIAAAAVRIGRRTLAGPVQWAMALASFVALFALNLPFPAIMIAALAIGLALDRWAPHLLRGADEHSASPANHPAALIDDDTPAPEHARFSRARALRVLLAFAALWIGAYAVVWTAGGTQGVLAQMARFFTSASLVTFGGAYAVLPYVNQGAVEHYHWLSTAQMIDGMALGETTPGPLIMVVSFIGFLGGWGRDVFGPDAALAGAVAGAAVATVFTFLPSFFFIFLGGPLIESTHGDARFTAALMAVSAAVAGVISNLALFLALHVFWPHGTAQAPDWLALVLAPVAAAALISRRAGIIPVIAACAAAGLLLPLPG